MAEISLPRAYSSPPAAYRPCPLFVFNDEHEGEAGEARITSMLEGYAEVGFGGAFLHPRPGLMTEYLSPRWFELIRHSVKECARLGLSAHLYDENSYPSGVGGGHVPAAVPETRTRYVGAVFGRGSESVPAGTLAVHRLRDGLPTEEIENEATPDEEWVAFAMGSMEPVAWHGETACPSLLDPRTAEAFLETTYEAYRRELGGLWEAVPSVFTDEPHLPAEGHGPWSPGLHLTPYILGQFRQRKGYDLRPHLLSVFYDVGDYRRVRFDLYDLMHELWVENWALPMERWCEEHEVALTGHYLEHDWPCPYATPGHVHMLAHMQWPGTDMLETFLLKGHDFHDIQNFHPAVDGREPHGLMYLRQVHSVANQLGKERVVDESWGAGGHDSTPADWARIGRWLIVHGVNLLIPHLSFTTIRGTRKSDHPQTFSDHSPWYEHLRPLNDELARLSWASNRGRIEQRVLVLDPLTTGYCISRKADCLPQGNGAASHTAGSPPGEEQFTRAMASVLELQRSFGELAQDLSDAQADFDLGDEYVIDEFGRVEDDAFVVGEQRYEIVVWPPHTTNLRDSTAQMLEEYLGGGGLLYGARPEEITVDGRPSDLLEQWEGRFPDRCRWFQDPETLVQAVLEKAPPRLRFDSPPETGLAHMRRVEEGSEILLVVNSSSETLESAFDLETEWSGLYELDPKTGACYPVKTRRKAGRLVGELRIAARAATVLWATGENAPADARPLSRAKGERKKLELEGVRRECPNVLVVDHCELEIGGEVHGPRLVYASNEELWRAHGMETNGWMATIQYRDQILARNRTMPPGSGGTARYRFRVSEDLDPSDMKLAIETPELWEVKVNGERIELADGERWLDQHIQAAAVGGLIEPGENVVELEGRPFDVRREIDGIYLLGDFSCVEDRPGFRLTPPLPLGLGSWRRQGYPFYEREVAYDFKLPAGEGQGVLHLDEGAWRGSFLLVELAGRVVARLWEPPYGVAVEGEPGETLTLRVVGLPKNLLGPWHDPERQRGRAWIPMWHGLGIPTSPQPGEHYDLLDLGLFEAPKWSASR
ncbi:MAG: hypothetical protein WKF28_02075 [Rubrobacteraceae bacterium]